jgi:peptide/nickel transport system ATP-binding protein
MSAPLLQVRGLSKRFRRRDKDIAAVVDVTLELARGETLAIVGPSGSGKSTLARIVMRLVEPDSGTITFDGVDLVAARGEALRRLRPKFQMVFQDPLAAFNPRATVAGVLDDPLRIHAHLAERRIHEISGGQRQRVAIARAIATRPRLLVLDEAVSALDVTVRAGILALLEELRKEEQLSYLFISHDLAVVSSFADRIAIMDAGRIVEAGPAAAVVAAPQSATGKALVAAMPKLRTGAIPA